MQHHQHGEIVSECKGTHDSQATHAVAISHAESYIVHSLTLACSQACIHQKEGMPGRLLWVGLCHFLRPPHSFPSSPSFPTPPPWAIRGWTSLMLAGCSNTFALYENGQLILVGSSQNVQLCSTKLEFMINPKWCYWMNLACLIVHTTSAYKSVVFEVCCTSKLKPRCSI